VGGGVRRRARRACFVAAAVCLLLSLVAAPSPAQEDDIVPPPEVFRGAATAQVASVQVDSDPPLLPVNDLFRFIVLDGASVFESSTRSARASLFFPGNGLILGPNLLCGTFGGAFPPEFKPILDLCLQYKYPLTVFADEFQPDGASSGAIALGAPTDPVSGTAVRASAHAAEDSATSDAALQDLRVLGLPALGTVLPLVPGLTVDTSLLSVDSAVSRTNQRIEQGSLLVDAEATMSGISLIGGLIRIGAVRSESHVTDDSHGVRTAESSLEVSGVTVAGVPSQITEDGLVLGSPTGALGPLIQQLQTQVNDLLRALGIKITVLAAEQDTDVDAGAVASAGGLLIEVAQPLSGLPSIPGPLGDIDPNAIYKASVQLGATAARASAFAFDPDAPPSDDGGSTDLGVDFGGSGGDLGIGPLPDLPSVPPAVTPPDGSDTPGSSGLISDIFDDRLGLVYLALMFSVLGLCLAPRLIVPARLPGLRS